jgi:hypothetical protein
VPISSSKVPKLCADLGGNNLAQEEELLAEQDGFIRQRVEHFFDETGWKEMR